MKNISEEQLIELAKTVFEGDVKLTKVYAASDGNVFTEDSINAALLYKQTARVGLICITRDGQVSNEITSSATVATQASEADGSPDSLSDEPSNTPPVADEPKSPEGGNGKPDTTTKPQTPIKTQ